MTAIETKQSLNNNIQHIYYTYTLADVNTQMCD